MTLARSVQISKRCGWYPCNCGLAPIQTFYSLMRKSLRRNKTGLFIPLSLSGPLCSNLKQARIIMLDIRFLRGLLSPLYSCQSGCQMRYQPRYYFQCDTIPFLHMETQRGRSQCLKRHTFGQCSAKMQSRKSCNEFETSRGTMILLLHRLKYKYWPRVWDSLPCRKSFHCKMAKC